MGRKQRKRRKFICFYIAALILLSQLGCNKIVKGTIVKETKEDTYSEKAYKHRLEANLFFAKGDYENALNEYRNVLDICEKDATIDEVLCPVDEALFNMGLIYAFSRNNKNDYEISIKSFDNVIKNYPKSIFSGQAKILVDILEENEKLNQIIQKPCQENKKLEQIIEKLQQENERLNQIIQKSKQVDIEIEDKRKEISK